jgi:subtilase family serine protease
MPSGQCLMNVYYPDDLQMILKKPLKVKKLKAGYGITKKFVVRGLPLVTGSASQFTAAVDMGNAVIEINEGNNEAVYTINVP